VALVLGGALLLAAAEAGLPAEPACWPALPLPVVPPWPEVLPYPAVLLEPLDEPPPWPAVPPMPPDVVPAPEPVVVFTLPAAVP